MFLLLGIFSVASLLVLIGWIVYLGLRYTNNPRMENQMGLFKKILVLSLTIILLCWGAFVILSIYSFYLFGEYPFVPGV